MAAFSRFVAVAAAVVVVFAATASLLVHAAPVQHPTWEQYKTMYKLTYTPAEDNRRKLVYEANMRTADEMARRNPLAIFGHNEYSAMTPNEFKAYHNADGYFKRSKAKARFNNVTHFSAAQQASSPSTMDWRSRGAVTYVKNQGQCGSCWSFSTTGNIEGQWFLAGNKLVAVSEQELVSCDTIDSGCNGGLMDNAFTWLIQNRGGWITSETDYPYVSGSGFAPACSLSGKPNVAQIKGYTDYEHSESAMATGCAANGPVSIGVDASSWQTYVSGILTDCTSSQVDHGVLIVGFDLTYTTPYWIIKNSWGKSWGENGYIRVGYGSNQCLITDAPSTSHAGSGPTPPPSGSGSSGSGQTTPAPTTQPPSGSGSSGSGQTTVPPTQPPSGSGSSGSGSGTFTQYVCPQAWCLSGCTGHTFPQNKCLQLNGGGSAIVTCGSGELNMQVYSSNDCSGSATSQQQPLDMCLQDTDGTYIYNTCSSADLAAVGTHTLRLTKSH